MTVGCFLVLITKPTWSTRIHENLFYTPSRSEFTYALQQFPWVFSKHCWVTVFRLFSHVIGHAGWSHFHGNIIHILFMGPGLEAGFGSADLGT